MPAGQTRCAKSAQGFYDLPVSESYCRCSIFSSWPAIPGSESLVHGCSEGVDADFVLYPRMGQKEPGAAAAATCAGVDQNGRPILAVMELSDPRIYWPGAEHAAAVRGIILHEIVHGRGGPAGPVSCVWGLRVLKNSCGVW
jgi:hypothetical protein